MFLKLKRNYVKVNYKFVQDKCVIIFDWKSKQPNRETWQQIRPVARLNKPSMASPFLPC